MSLRIRRLKLISTTLKATYVADLKFADGLVLLHVRNTSGKSTALKAIVYALGLERMFGPANQPPLTPAMTSVIKEGEDEFPVVESNVFLEIANHEGRTLTIRRKVTGEGGKSWKLVDVWESAVLDLPRIEIEPREFYVRDEGSATRDQGFYPFLAKFIGWDLPDVVRFDGPTCPLYMECLLPLFYVEQSHGWTAIQATTPRFFQIRNVERKAIEFILGLQSGARDTARQQLESEEGQIKQSWLSHRTKLDGIARMLNGTLRNMPTEPEATWPLEVTPFAEVHLQGAPIPLSEAIASEAASLHRLETEDIPSAEEASEAAQGELFEAQEQLAQSETFAADTYEDLQLERTNLTAIETRLVTLDEDLDHNLGTKKLRDMGATSGLAVAKGECPTCHQPIEDSLLSQNADEHVMTLDENIAYIRAQKQTLDKMKARTESAVQAMERRLQAVVAFGNDLRGRIRALKRTLTSAGGAPSEAAVRERLIVEERLERFRLAAERWEEVLPIFAELTVRWREVQSRKKQIRDEKPSEDDERKRRALEIRFIELLRLLGFRSFAPERFNIDRESARPTREGFDVVYDVSASDNVRTIAGYLTAILELARTFKTNHPGLLILDEPRQQNLHWGDLAALLERLASSLEFGQQVIIATSDPSERIAEIAQRVQCTRIDLDGPILRRVVDGPTP